MPEPQYKAIGLKWRVRFGVRAAYWICPEKIVKSGYPVRSARLWSGAPDEWPTEEQMKHIRHECLRLHSEARTWSKKGSRWESGKRRKRAPGQVYFVMAGGRIKIGFSSELWKRLRSIRTTTGQEIQLLGVLEGSKEIERFIHWQFRKTRINGEWFEKTENLLAFVTEHTEPHPFLSVPKLDPILRNAPRLTVCR